MVERRTLGWMQTCNCPEVTTVPSLVFDPFGGSGTVALVAEHLGRRGCVMDLNGAYLELARERLGLVSAHGEVANPLASCAPPALPATVQP